MKVLKKHEFEDLIETRQVVVESVGGSEIELTTNQAMQWYERTVPSKGFALVYRQSVFIGEKEAQDDHYDYYQIGGTQ